MENIGDLRADALDYLTAADAAAFALNDCHKALHDLVDTGRRPTREVLLGRKIGEANKGIEAAHRLASVHALLYIGDMLERIADQLEDREPADPGTLPGATERLICAVGICENVAAPGDRFCGVH